MAKRKADPYMSSGEKIAGTIFFLVYLLVLPFITTPMFDIVGELLDTTISSAVRNNIFYYALLVVTVVIFHGFLGRTSTNLADNLGPACQTLLVGLVAMYGLNELAYRLTNLMISNGTNLNDTTISAQIDDAPKMTLLIIVLVAPFVEEVLFRGLVFGALKGKSRAVAYVLSCLAFALLHVWQFAVVHQNVTHLLLMIQYLIPGLVLAWVYDRSGTLWTSIGLHAAVNALAMFT